MARINLLHGERSCVSSRRRDFGLTILGALLLTLAGLGYWHWYNQGLIDLERA